MMPSRNSSGIDTGTVTEMDSFKVWLEELGLADPGFTGTGKPKVKNTKLRNRYELPDVPTYTYERDRGVATKLDPG